MSTAPKRLARILRVEHAECSSVYRHHVCTSPPFLQAEDEDDVSLLSKIARSELPRVEGGGVAGMDTLAVTGRGNGSTTGIGGRRSSLDDLKVGWYRYRLLLVVRGQWIREKLCRGHASKCKISQTEASEKVNRAYIPRMPDFFPQAVGAMILTLSFPVPNVARIPSIGITFVLALPFSVLAGLKLSTLKTLRRRENSFATSPERTRNVFFPTGSRE